MPLEDEDEEDFDGEGKMLEIIFVKCSPILTNSVFPLDSFQMVTMQRNVKRRKKMTTKRNCQPCICFYAYIYIFFLK